MQRCVGETAVGVSHLAVQAEEGRRDSKKTRGLADVAKRQVATHSHHSAVQ